VTQQKISKYVHWSTELDRQANQLSSPQGREGTAICHLDYRAGITCFWRRGDVGITGMQVWKGGLWDLHKARFGKFILSLITAATHGGDGKKQVQLLLWFRWESVDGLPQTAALYQIRQLASETADLFSRL